MKISFLIVLIISVFSFRAKAQKKPDSDVNEYLLHKEKTVFENKKRGVYFAVTTNYTAIDNQDAIAIGCRGGWIFWNKVAFGFSSYFFMNGYRANPTLGDKYSFEFNTEGVYAGFFIEPKLWEKRKVSLTAPIFLGVGAVSFMSNYYDYYLTKWYLEEIDDDAFLYAEPGLELEYSFSKHFKIAFGAYYRLTSNLDMKGINTNSEQIELLSPNAIQSLSLGITLKVGLF